MPRAVIVVASMILTAASTSLFLTGCGSIKTESIPGSPAPIRGSTARLTPNPDHIYIAPFNIETGKWLVGREGIDLVDFKNDFNNNFIHVLQDRLTKLAPTEPRWVDDLPDHGWLVAGEFITVYQGSRFLRAAVGAGAGETTLQTNVYVYDLSQSKTQYILSFRTGVPGSEQKNSRGAYEDTGAGSGSAPAGVSAGGEPISTAIAIGSGLKLDTTRTCREIAAILAKYM
jgi:hypothetical protein